MKITAEEWLELCIAMEKLVNDKADLQEQLDQDWW